MKSTTRFILPLAVLFANSIAAQNWVVGEPVELTLGQITIYGSGCAPGPDEALNFPASMVAGVDHVAIVSVIQTSGDVLMDPGPAAPLEAGDTVWLSISVTRELFFTAGTGSIQLLFKAVGTPTMAGQAHPCSASDQWISDLGICPETLTMMLENNCMTQAATGIVGMEQGTPWFTGPSAANGQRLKLERVRAGTVQVVDGLGRLYGEPYRSQKDGFDVDMAAAPSGVYVVRADQMDGTPMAARFLIVR